MDLLTPASTVPWKGEKSEESQFGSLSKWHFALLAVWNQEVYISLENYMIIFDQLGHDAIKIFAHKLFWLGTSFQAMLIFLVLAGSG